MTAKQTKQATKASKAKQASRTRKFVFPWEMAPPTPTSGDSGPVGGPRRRRGVTRFPVGACVMAVPDDMVWAFFRDGTYYEQNVTYWIETLFSRGRGRVFYDVGANYGFFSLLLADRAVRIHAFEPVSATRRVLASNIRANRLDNIEVHRVGLSDARRTAEIHLYGCSGKNSVYPMSHVREPLLGTERISLVPLDDLFEHNKLAPPDLIKIDIEGGELAALRGARKLLERFGPALVVEYLDWQFKDAGYRRRDLLAELERSGYVVYGIPEDITDFTAYPIARAGRIELASIIAVPAGKQHLIARPSARKRSR